MLGLKASTRSRGRRRALPNSSASTSTPNIHDDCQSAGSDVQPNEAQQGAMEDPTKLELPILPECAAEPFAGNIREVPEENIKMEEIPSLPLSSLSHPYEEPRQPARVMRCAPPARRKGNISPSSCTSARQPDASSSTESISSTEVMRCTLPSPTIRSPSTAASFSCQISVSNEDCSMQPARVMRCPVRTARTLRCDHPNSVNYNQTTAVQSGSDSSNTLSPQSVSLKCLPSTSTSVSAQSSTAIISPPEPEKILDSDTKKELKMCPVPSLDSNSNEGKETRGSKANCTYTVENLSSRSKSSVLHCRSGQSSYPLRALKVTPFYCENGFGTVYFSEPKTRVKRTKEVSTAKSTNHKQIYSFPVEKENAHIGMLPDEVLCMIFSYISHVDLLKSCATVCQRWHTLVKCPTLWQTLSFSGQHIPLEIVCGLIRFSPVLKSITIKDRNDIDAILPILHQQCKRLEAVSLVRCRPCDESQRNLRAKSLYPFLRKGQLRSLNLKGTDYRSKKFYQMLSFMQNLRKLNISCSKSVTPQILCEIAKHSSLKVFKNKWHSNSIYNGPKSMTIQLPGKIDDWASAYTLIFQNTGQNLTTLEFFAAGITDVSLAGLASCKKLKKLSLYNANLFGSEGMAAVSSLTELQDLLIHNAKLSTNNVVSAFQTDNLSGLKYLHFNDSIQTGSDDIPADDCLKIVSEKCQFLLHLSFTNCPSVTDSGVLSVLTNCSQLMSLDLNGGSGIAGQSLLLLPTRTPHLKLLIIEEDSSKEKKKIVRSLTENHGISVQTKSTWKHRSTSYYL